MQSKSEFTEAQCARLLRRLTSRINTLRNLLQVAPSYIKSPAVGLHRNGHTTRRKDVLELDYRPGLGRRRNPTPEYDDTDDTFGIQPRPRARVQYSKNARRNKATKAGLADAQRSVLTEPIPREFCYGEGSVQETMEKCLKPLMHKEVYAAVKAIILQVDDIVVETKRDVSNRPLSLSEMIAAKIGKYAGTCEVEDDVENLSNEVVGFGQASYLKSMLRGQALGMFQRTLDEDFFWECAPGNRVVVEARIVGVMVKALLERSAFSEAGELVEFLISRESTVDAARPLFELVANCFASSRILHGKGQLSAGDHLPDPSSPCNLTLTSLRYRLCVELLSSSHSRRFLASATLRDILEEGLLCYARYEAVLHPKYFAEVEEFTMAYLLKAFGLGPKHIQLQHSDSFLRRKQRNSKKASRKPARKPSLEQASKPLSYIEVEKAEKTLMLVVMALAGGCFYTPGGTEGILQKVLSDDSIRHDCPIANPLVAKLACLFLTQRRSDLRQAEQLWGGKVSYPIEAKSLVLFRYLIDIDKGTSPTEGVDRGRIMERIYEAISSTDSVNRMESAQHIVNVFVGSPQLFSRITIEEIVDTILRFINGDFSSIQVSTEAQTPVRPSLITDDRRSVLATFAVDMALHYVQVAADNTKKTHLVAWAEGIQKEVVKHGLYTPAKPKQSKAAGVPWQRPPVEMSAKTRRQGYRYIAGIGEWVAIGCTPGRVAHGLAGHLNGSPSSGKRRTKRPINYKEPELTPSSELIVSDDVEMEENVQDDDSGTVMGDEDDGLSAGNFYLEPIVPDSDEESEVSEQQSGEDYDGYEPEDRVEEEEEVEDSTADSIVMSPLFESAGANDTNSDLSNDDGISGDEDPGKDSQMSTASRQFMCAVVIPRRGPFSDIVSNPNRIDNDGELIETFSPRRKRPSHSVKVMIPESPSKRRAAPRLRNRNPPRTSSSISAYVDASDLDRSDDELFTAPAIPVPPRRKRRAAEIFDSASEDVEEVDDEDDEYVEGRTKPRRESSNRSRPRKRRSVTPATSDTASDYNPKSRPSRTNTNITRGKRLLSRSSGHTLSRRVSTSSSYMSGRTRSGRSSGKSTLALSDDELSFF
ncbi:hypothetical protein BJ508DRAFT_409970 [Ascobolus immersus RN42]|uniref:Uncharacterized protein n=1 Tax=Ascobolus immersus RN42 TaxID=1160509 RepID=A0A3N4IPE3_ASCIM|nr:hypothetical protein BJ508DRAFT_409970 [Ascobolus immersus RN42]